MLYIFHTFCADLFKILFFHFVFNYKTLNVSMNDKTTFVRVYLYNQLLGIYEAWVLKGFEIELDPDVNKKSSKIINMYERCHMLL